MARHPYPNNGLSRLLADDPAEELEEWTPPADPWGTPSAGEEVPAPLFAQTHRGYGARRLAGVLKRTRSLFFGVTAVSGVDAAGLPPLEDFLLPSEPLDAPLRSGSVADLERVYHNTRDAWEQAGHTVSPPTLTTEYKYFWVRPVGQLAFTVTLRGRKLPKYAEEVLTQSNA